MRKFWSILLDHRLFMAVVGLIFIGTFAALIYGQWFAKDPRAEDIVEYPLDRPPVAFPMELYVADEFSDKQLQLIHKAASDWESFTRGVARVKLVEHWVPEYPFDPDTYQTYSKRTLWYKKTTDPSITSLILKHGFFDGVTKGDYIVVVEPVNVLPDTQLYIVIKHELGHLFALEHLKPQYPGLMLVGGNDGDFTHFDTIQFCHFYRCP